MARRRRRIVGVIPRLGGRLWAWAGRAVRHPQPLILCGALAISVWALWGHAQRADAFRIAHVSFPPNVSFTLDEPILNTNLWDLDLQAFAAGLKRQQPWLKDVRVIRQLPNAIRIDVIPRLPVAQVRLDHWYPVDREGFLLPQGNAEPADYLVRMSGVERGGTVLRVGKENTDARLQLALRVLQQWRKSAPPLARRLAEINVADPHALRFILDGGIEVRCGSEPELDTQLRRLATALKAIARQPLTVQYIDVRFPEPVIGSRP